MPLVFYNVPLWFASSVITILFVLFAVLGVEVVYKLHPTEFRHGYNDIVGFLIAVVGVLYAVLLASVAIMAMNKYDTAEMCIMREASFLGDIQRVSYGLSPGMCRAVRLSAIEYGNTVLDKEWPVMQKGGIPQDAWEKLKAMQSIVLNFEPVTMKQQNVHMQMITKMGELADARRERIHIAQESIEIPVWRTIILGNVGMIAFSFFFGLNKRWHQILSGSLAALSALVIVLIGALDRPYMGKVSVSPEVLRQAVMRIER